MFTKVRPAIIPKTQIKRHCKSVFLKLKEKLDISGKVNLITLSIPFSSANGFTLSIGKKDNAFYFVVLNLAPFKKKYRTSSTLAHFFLYSVIAHELKHIKILEEWYNGELNETGVLFSEWALYHLGNGLFLDRVIRSYLAFRETSSFRKKRYDVSPIELLCYNFGFQEAYSIYSNQFSEDELNIVSTIVDSIDFINRHIEIDYFSSKQAYNRFTHSIYYLQRLIRRYPEKISRFPQLQFLFSNIGLIKSPEELFGQRNNKNKELIDYVLIRMFITMSYDWSNTFEKSPKLYDHIATLSNQYCMEAIHYLKNISIGEVLLNRSILHDNAAMLIMNVNTINNLMVKYNIPHTSGSVIPLYFMDNK